MMGNKILLIAYFCFLSLIGFSQTSDKTILWSEDFTGCYYMPTRSINADYDGSNSFISFSNDAGGSNPEISIKRGTYLKAKVYFYGAYGTFTLKFNVRDPDKVQVTLDDVSTKKGKFLQLYPSDNHHVYCTFDIEKGTTYKTIYINGKNNSSTYIDNLVLEAPANCREQRKSPELKFSTSQITVYRGEKSIFPTLENKYSQEIHYFSTDHSVAEIGESDGKFDIKDVGKTTIYAICYGGTIKNNEFEENEYSYQTVSYILNVKRKKPIGEIFYESFDKNLSKGGHASDFSSGSGNVEDINFDNKPLGTTEKVCPAYKCLYVGNVALDGTYAIKPFDKVDNINNKKGKIIFKLAGSNVDGEKNCKLTISNKTKSYNYNIPSNENQWEEKSIEINDFDQNTTLAFSGKRFFLDDISVIIEDKEDSSNIDISIGEFGYATLYYSNLAFVVPEGVTAFTIKLNEDKTTALPNRVYQCGDVIPNDEAVILNAKEGVYTFQISDISCVNDIDNLLKGTDSEDITTGGNVYYLFGVDKKTKEVGFYWGADNGGPFQNGAHKAYLPIQNSIINSAKSIPVMNNNYTTGISLFMNEEKISHTYNLSGQCVGDNYHGILVRNHKKFLKK